MTLSSSQPAHSLRGLPLGAAAALALTLAPATVDAQDPAPAIPPAVSVAPEAAPPAPSGPTIRPLASFFTRTEHRVGYEDLGAGNPGCFPGINDGDCIRYRAELGFAVGDLQLGHGIEALIRFVPQANGFWSIGGTSGGVTLPNVGLFQGNLTLDVVEAGVSLEIGRIVLNYGDQRIIGALRWHPAGRSFDGARLRIQPDDDGAWVDLFYTMLTEGGAGAIAVGDRHFYGAYAGLGPLLGTGVDLDVYGLVRQDHDQAVAPDLGWRLRAHVGARFRHRVSLVDVRAEGGAQFGRQGRELGQGGDAIVAGHLDAEVGLNLADDAFRFSGHGFVASGDDPNTTTQEAYDQLFPTAHLFLGLSDVMGGRSNVTGGAAHVKWVPLGGLIFRIDGYLFARPQGFGDPFAGGEVDALAIWRPARGLGLRAVYALFVPNPSHWATTGDPVHYLEVELAYDLR